MSDDPNKISPAEPPPSPSAPEKAPGSIAGGCAIYFLFLILLCIVTSYRLLNIRSWWVVPALFLGLVIYHIIRRGWNRTHTGILIGVLLTGGIFLLLWSICGGQHY
jgi:hypothetical protein